ncbi:MAG: hypothetical protein LBK96_05070, partial [Prevotellaceae bacterium]|nr:hypothetical protein [Prevotellaceae bacterium]
LTDREKWDIRKITENSSYYSSLPERRRTEALSMVAVLASGHNLEYVPEAFLNRNICRAALNSKDVDCTVLPCIPYPDVQKEAIQKFSADTPAFVLYSFVDIRDVQMAGEAVKADAYCLQLVPDKLLTADLCKMALNSPNADEKMLKFAVERFPKLTVERIPKEEKTQHNTGVKMKF